MELESSAMNFNLSLFTYFYLLTFTVLVFSVLLEMESRTACILAKHSETELNFQLSDKGQVD